VGAHEPGSAPGYTLEAAAVRLSEDITELREEGGIPQHVRTVIGILPGQRVLEIRVEGLSVEADPDRTIIREGDQYAVRVGKLREHRGPQRHARRCSPNVSCLVGADGRPFSAMIGAAVGDVESVTAHGNWIGCL